MNRRWKILIGVGIFIVLMAGVVIIKHVWLVREVDAYKKYLRDKGEKLDLGEVLPPPSAPEENSVDAVQAAFAKISSSYEFVPIQMGMVAPGKALIGWRQPDAREYDFTNSWDEFATRVETNRPAIELLHQVLARPMLDFGLDYQKGIVMWFPQLAPMKRAAQILDAATIMDLHNGQTGAAATNILILLALVHKDVRDELLISHLVRAALAAIAVPVTWELLQATNVTDPQLAAVQNGWQQMDFLGDAENSFVVERICSDMVIQKTRSSHTEFNAIFSPGYSSSSGGASGGSAGWATILEDVTAGPRAAVGEAMWRSSWSYSSELHMLQSDQVVLEALRAMRTNQSQFYKADYDKMSSRLSSLGFTNTDGALFDALNIPDFRDAFAYVGGPVVRKALRIETARRVVITAIALKRFQLKHGAWPDTLEELAPEMIPSIPIDPYDGKPLKYHVNADGTFLLYSVGDDGVDNGGDVTPVKSSNSSTTSWSWQRARDWVWPQPASPAEVQSYHEHPPK